MTGCIAEGIFHSENLTWHSTASVASHWSTAFRKIPRSEPLGMVLPLKSALPTRDLVPIKYTVPWHTRVDTPNSIYISSAIFARLMVITGRQTDRPCYSIVATDHNAA